MMSNHKNQSDSPSTAGSDESLTTTPSGERDLIDSSDLVGRDGTIRILHSGEIYTLRITRNNRLILTK